MALWRRCCLRRPPSTRSDLSLTWRCRNRSIAELPDPGLLRCSSTLHRCRCFALQHSVMARQGFKRWWTRAIPKSGRALHLCPVRLLVRSSSCSGCGCRCHIRVWHIEEPLARLALLGLFWIGWLVVGVAAARTNQSEMLGFQQTLDAAGGQEEHFSDLAWCRASIHSSAPDLCRLADSVLGNAT